ncbi:MAG: hypothetical protein KGZ39_01280 [Simkania sp.]|nr:hypothetical protein [Simkania sp.]
MPKNEVLLAETDFFHSLSIEETFKRLASSPLGLSSEEVEKRQKQFGKNVLIEEPIAKPSFVGFCNVKWSL